MADEIEVPELVVKTSQSQFRLRCHAAAWASEYGGRMKIHRRYGQESPGLLMLSATGPDTAVKSVRATLYQPDIEAEFLLEEGDTTQQMVKARITFDGKPVVYSAAMVKLAPGVIHMVALAKIPGLMPNMSDDHLWAELTGPRYTTPLLRSWIPWLKEMLAKDGGIVVGEGFASSVGVLKTEPDKLDAVVSMGVKEGHLQMVGGAGLFQA
jgi:hypothetical protein